MTQPRRTSARRPARARTAPGALLHSGWPALARAAWLALALVSGCARSGSAPGGRLLVTSGGTDQLFVLDAATGRLLDSLALDRRLGERDEPHGVAVASDGRHWYATLAHGEPSLWKVEAGDDRVVGRLTLETFGASRVRLSPDGALAAVPDYWLSGGGAPSRVAFVRTLDLSLAGAPELCAGPHDAAFSPDGSVVAVTCALGDEVVVVDPTTLRPLGSVALGDDARPMNGAWTSDGRILFVSLMGDASVARLQADADGALRETARVRVGARPAQLEVSPDGRWLVVANRGDGTVALVPLDRGGAPAGERVDVRLPGANPHGVAFGPRPDVAWVTWEGDSGSYGGVAALDVEAGRLLWATEVGQYTLGVAWAATAAR